MLWVPDGFAHGFLALQDGTHFLYKTTAYYAPESERAILWNDQAINIAWPKLGAPYRISAKDEQSNSLKDAAVFA